MKKIFKDVTFKPIDDSRFLKTFGEKASIPLLEITQSKDRNDLILVDIREYSSYDETSCLVAEDYMLHDYLVFGKNEIDFLINFIKDNIGDEIFIVASEFNSFFKFIKKIC